MARERTLLTENMAKLTPKYKILRVKKPYINFLFSRRIPNQAWMGRCETVNIIGIGLLTIYNQGTTQAADIE